MEFPLDGETKPACAASGHGARRVPEVPEDAEGWVVRGDVTSEDRTSVKNSASG